MRVMKSRGFTLVELMIGVVIVAILLLLALPTFQEWMTNSRIRNTASSIANGMRLAQVEAIKRNRPVEFTLVPATGWSVVDADADLGGTLHQETWSDTGGQVTVQAGPAGATRVVFDGLGRYMTVVDPPLAPIVAPNPIDVINLTSATVAGAKNLRVVADPALGVGIRVCDPDFTNLADAKTGSIACP